MNKAVFQGIVMSEVVFRDIKYSFQDIIELKFTDSEKQQNKALLDEK